MSEVIFVEEEEIELNGVKLLVHEDGMIFKLDGKWKQLTYNPKVPRIMLNGKRYRWKNVVYHAFTDDNWDIEDDQRKHVFIKDASLPPSIDNLSLMKIIPFEKSFASYEGITVKGKKKVECWHLTKNRDKPRDVARCSHEKRCFNCDVCSHDFFTTLDKVSNGKWCPYCTKYGLKLCKDKECVSCEQKSFSSYDGITVKGNKKVERWHPTKNRDKPRDVTRYSDKKRCFNCDVCSHDFFTTLYSVSNGHWCPYCKKKTEGKFLKWLEDIRETLENILENIFGPMLPIEIYSQCNFDWCRNTIHHKKSCFPFDFKITFTFNERKHTIIFEVDGRHHFMQVSNWDNTPEFNLMRDLYKQERAKENECMLIRICQEDIYHDRNNWQKKVISAIKRVCEEIKRGIPIYGLKECIGNQDKYERHLNGVYCHDTMKELQLMKDEVKRD